MEIRSPLFAEAQTLTKRLAQLPQTTAQPPRALIVGGFVRDLLLDLEAKDIDLEVYGVPQERLEAFLQEQFPGRLNLVGKAFGIFKVHFDQGDLDIALPRRESKTDQGHRGFVVEGDPTMEVTEAARRRDFTINAISYNPLLHTFIDPFFGQRDLENRVLRVVDVNSFQEDPLRIYRAIQLCSRFQLKIEETSSMLMQQMVKRGDLKELAKERVTQELEKWLLKSPKPSIGLEAMHELGIIAQEYPELEALIGCEQEPEWHPEGDVWIHTGLALDQARQIVDRSEPAFSQTEALQILLGTLCHDLGKPSTTQCLLKDGALRIRSLGHEEAGGAFAQALLARWSFSQEINDAVIKIAEEHLKPGMLAYALEKGTLTPAQYLNAIRKLLRRIHPVSWRVLLACAEADSRGRTLPNAQTEPYIPGKIFEEAVTKNELATSAIKHLIQGTDLLELGVHPGKTMGDLIRFIENERDKGTITTKAEALELIQRKIGNKDI